MVGRSDVWGTVCWAGGQLNVQFAAVVRRVGEIVADVLCRVGDAHGDVVIGQEARAGDDVAGDGDGRRGRSGGSSCAWVVGRGISHQSLRSPHGGASRLLPAELPTYCRHQYPQIGWLNRTPSTQARTSGRSREWTSDAPAGCRTSRQGHVLQPDTKRAARAPTCAESVRNAGELGARVRGSNHPADAGANP